MMAYLSFEVADFGLLAAVDRSFDIFYRLWCIAEMYEAYITGIPMHVCIESNRVFDPYHDDTTIYKKLVLLSAEKCEASRPADKTYILSKIKDINDFDAQLQGMIFGRQGLLRTRLVGFDALAAAAFSAKRVHSVVVNAIPLSRSCE